MKFLILLTFWFGDTFSNGASRLYCEKVMLYYFDAYLMTLVFAMLARRKCKILTWQKAANIRSAEYTVSKKGITKTCLYNFKSHFYLVKLGFTGVYIIFLISAQNIDCGDSLEPPRRGGSNEYLQSMF